MGLLINSTSIEVAIGDLAFQAADALIHPTNNYLWFSTGGSENLKRRGGDALEEKAMTLGPIEIGQAVITEGGRLKCKFLIHAAAWGQDLRTNEKHVHRAMVSALNLARGYECQSAALPVTAFSLADFALPRAMETVFMSVVEHCMQPTTIKRIILLVANPAEKTALENLLQMAKSADPPKIIEK